MGWEAIEQYLTEVEREASLDQQVPQMLVDGLEVMQTDSDQETTAFYPDELVFNKPTPIPVSDIAASEREETVDYYDLDQELRSTRDTSLHQKEDIDIYRNIDESYDISSANIQGHVTIKSEPFSDLLSCSQRGGRCNTYCSDDTDSQFWTMKSEAISVCLQDVLDTCRCLGVSPDALHWSRDQVQQWIVWQCRQFNVPQPKMEYFFLPGTELCTLSEEDFKLFAPEAGSTLFSRLDVWRSVVEQTTNHCSSQSLQIPVPKSPSLPGSSGTSSPTHSSFSDSDSQPATPPAQPPICADRDRLPAEPVHHHRQTITLSEFLKLLLLDGKYTDCIRWQDRPHGVFKIENSSRVARLWGLRKNRPAMNYDKLSRSIRQYYKKNIIKKTEQSKRLVYQFCKLDSII